MVFEQKTVTLWLTQPIQTCHADSQHELEKVSHAKYAVLTCGIGAGILKTVTLEILWQRNFTTYFYNWSNYLLIILRQIYN